MLDAALVLFVLALLLVVIGLIQPLAVRLKLPPIVLLAVVGVAIGVFSSLPLGDLLPERFATVAALFGELPLTSETIIYVFLPLLVFEAAITSDVRRIIEDAAPILFLAIVATVVTTFAIGFALWSLAPVPLIVCLLLGAVVATTDPAAVIAVFRDVGAPARLSRLVEGEALLNDATAIALFVVILGMITAGREPDFGAGASEFAVSFLGGGAFGVIAGRLLLRIIPWSRDDRLAEATLTVALAYLVFIIADRWLHVSGVVGVLAAGLTISAVGRARIAPYNWAFLADLWEQIAFWSRSLVFVLASILVPKLLASVGLRDLLLLVVLILAALGSRILVLFLLLPPLSGLRLMQPISAAYKLAIAWGALRGALTLALGLAVTENPALSAEAHRFVAELATGLVLFTLLVGGTTLRPFIRLLGLDRLSPHDQVLRDQVLALSYAEICETARATAEQHHLAPEAVAAATAPYEAWIAEANTRDAASGALTEANRLGIALVALGNQERALALETLARRSASSSTVQVLLRHVDAIVEGARSAGRPGYERAAAEALSFSWSFRGAYFLYRRLAIARFLADQLGDRFELLLSIRSLITDLIVINDQKIRTIFGGPIADQVAEILAARLDAATAGVEALRRQYPDYAAALETRFLRQSALRREMGRYEALYEEGLIAREVYDDLRRSIDETRAAEKRPRFDLGLDTRELIGRLDLLAGLNDRQLARVQKLLRPRFTVPNEVILRTGERGEAVFFIASGVVEVRVAGTIVQLGTGDFFGEMALLSGRPRQADVVALTYCRLLVLRRADFERFMAENPDARAEIYRIAAERDAINRSAETPAATAASK
jgi:CPA1 family monovalent cation:H+ antiporter